MKVKVEFIIDTTDYGEKEFKCEIEQLVKEIDPLAEILSFEMREA